MRNSYITLVRLLTLAGALALSSTDGYSQCTNPVSNGNAISVIPCGTFATVGVGSGTYQDFTGLLPGASYTFETCGTPFNSNLTVFSPVNTQIGFSTNACSDDGSFTGTSFSGTARVHVNNDACTGWVSGQGSAVLSYRQNNNLTFTSSSADMCPGNTRGLTATPPGGTFTGTGVSGTTFTAPTTPGPYVITYTYGQCSATQTINVVSPSVAATNVVASPAAVCPGGGATLSVVGGSLGQGATWTWYAGGCGQGSPIGTGNSITVNPSATTTYFVLPEGGCNTVSCASVQVTVNTVSTAPTSITATNLNVCAGSPTTLTVNGGSLGTGAQWLWYIGNCGGQLVGGGSSITVSPQSTTRYYVLADGPCGTTTCAFVIITVTPSPSAGFSNITSPSACGASDGTITSDPTGGTQPYSYQWVGGPSTQTYSGLSAGPYTVIVTDASGCSDQATVSLDDPGSATVTLASDAPGNVICEGDLVTLTASGAYQYQYYINSVPVSNVPNPWQIDSLQNGDQVQVVGIDFNFCSATSNTLVFTVNENPDIAETVSDPTACGASDGSVTTLVTGGLPNYTYLWSYNSASTPDITGVPAGPYFLTVTDVNGCSSSETYGLSDPGAAPVTLNSSEQPGNEICAGEQVTFTASGSVTYQFYVDGSQVGPTNPYVTTTLTNGQSTAATGTDAFGCTATSNIILTTVNPGPLITLVSDAPNETICVGQDISFFASGGLIYEFLVNGVSQGPASATSLFIGSGLADGDTVTVIGTDGNQCDVESADLIITVNPTPVVSIFSQQDPTGCGAMDGAVTVSTTGGTTPYAYQWQGGPADSVYTGLMAGSYFVEVTDASGCVGVTSASLSDIGSSPVSMTSDYPTDTVCEGLPVTFTSSGATNYVYYLNGVQVSTMNPFIIDSLQDGDIIAVTGLDTQLCAATSAPVQFTVHPEVQIGITASLNPSSCQASDGQATTITIGGTPQYTYLWSDNSTTTPNISGLPAGPWMVTVTDANGCSDSDLVLLSDIGASVATLTADPGGISTICEGTEIEFTASGSVQYEFYVDVTSAGTTNPYVTDTIQNGQTISVVATDQNGCVYTSAGLMYQVNPAPNVQFPSVGPACDNVESMMLTGGLPVGGEYTVVYTVGGISVPTTSSAFFPDMAGAGTIDIVYEYENNVGCVGSATAVMTVNAAPEVDLGNDTTACVYDLDAGAGFVSYLWCGSNNPNQTLTVNETGNYCVRVEDSNGCYGYDTVLVVVNPLPDISLSPFGDTLEYCVGQGITVAAPPSYVSYVWNNGAPTSQFTFTVTQPGDLTLSVTDQNGCIGTVTVYVVENEPMGVSEIQMIGQEPFCVGGSVQLVAESGYASYLWNTGSTTSAITVVETGCYWLTTLDGNGCIDSTTQTDPVCVEVWDPQPQVDFASNTFTVTDSQNYTGYQWFFNGNPIPGATSSSYEITASGYYRVEATDANGCVGGSDVFEVYYDPIGISETDFDGSVNVYPNPNNGEFIVDISLNTARDLTVEMYDVVGKVIWQDAAMGSADNVRKKYDVRELPNGVYFLRVTADQQMTVVKLIKQ